MCIIRARDGNVLDKIAVFMNDVYKCKNEKRYRLADKTGRKASCHKKGEAGYTDSKF